MIGAELAQDTVGASWEGGHGLGPRRDVALVLPAWGSAGPGRRGQTVTLVAAKTSLLVRCASRGLSRGLFPGKPLPGTLGRYPAGPRDSSA